MTTQPGANLYTQGFGSRPENVEVPHVDVRAPANTDINYPIGKRWIETSTGSEYTLTSKTTFGGVTSANWAEFITSQAGALTSLTTDDSTVVLPTNGNVNLNGTANQIVTSGSNSPGDVVLALSSTLVAPGTLTSTGLFTASSTSTFNGLLTANASATIRTGATTLNLGQDSGSGAINIGNGSSLRVIGIGNGSAGGTITIGAAVGTTSTTITAGSGGITLGAALNDIKGKTGAAGICGTATLTSGTVTVATTAVTSSSLIFVSYNTPEAVPGVLSAPVASISAGVHFVINSTDATDSTSTVNWLIIN